ncbi:MarR family winged helix-turn-helix transcriptional regulator [Nocardioides cynanchi]|jgi:DNA-binding MarR family transcriptional regulator|uniref:MarR family winged helix-turn-helix transcriptional regulator n=1 Tax=Nocardioides cynanchi TaxID=2558918 RepID=UPI0012472E66|nr:MarR family transcriptional regulator [Nocardioides cynanchi]
MTETRRLREAEALAGTSRALVAIVVRSMAAGSAEVTVAQHRVLVLLEERGALSVNALAEGLGVDQSNASRHCSRLARLGLVSRNRAPHDGRAVEVRLTPEGRRQVAAVDQARSREIQRVLDRLPDPSVAEVVKAFELFHEAAGAAGLAAAP